MIGVVMGALLVTVLWYLCSVGDAILWREQAQNAADAAAFENAVWNARGMNVIAAINIVMSLVLAILVIWRLVFMLLTIALAISVVVSFITAGVASPAAGGLGTAVRFMATNDNRVATTIVRILTAMNAAEVAVATATPILGQHQSSGNTMNAYRVTSATAFSASHLPSFNNDVFTHMRTCFAGGRSGGKSGKGEPKAIESGKGSADNAAAGGQTPAPDKLTAGKAARNTYDFFKSQRMGVGVSLPVQEDYYYILCKRAGEFGLRQYVGLLRRMHAPDAVVSALGTAQTVAGKITEAFSDLFCSPGGIDSIYARVSAVLEKGAGDSCKSEIQKKDEPRRVIAVDGNGVAEVRYRRDDGTFESEEERVSGCKKATSKAQGKEVEKARESSKDDPDFSACGKPAKVWEYAINGNVFMRSFAVIEKDTPMARRDDRGLAVGAMNNAVSVPPVQPESIGAHAEMYFDCPGQWYACYRNAMWQLRWSARLRRIQPMQNLLSTAVEPIAASLMGKVWNKVAETILPKPLVPTAKPMIPHQWAPDGDFMANHPGAGAVIH